MQNVFYEIAKAKFR